MRLLKTYLVTLSLSASLVACSDSNDVKNPLQVPTTYDGSAFATNAATQLVLRTQVANLLTESKKSRTVGVKVPASSLTSLLVTGNPSLKSIGASSYLTSLEGTTGLFAKVEKASGNSYTITSPNASGGVAGGYLFDETGIDLNEAVEKNAFIGILYAHAMDITTKPLTSATPDQLLAIFGANPTFPNSSTAKVTQPDVFMAGYAARRDKNDGKGFYAQIKSNIIKLQAAIKAGDKYKSEQQEALSAIKLTWEKAAAASAINYCHSVLTTLSNTTLTEAQQASALHALSEGIGFVGGWKHIGQGHRKITDTQINEILTLFNANASYKVIVNPATELPKIQQALTNLQKIYGFTATEVEDFKSNWMNVQGR